MENRYTCPKCGGPNTEKRYKQHRICPGCALSNYTDSLTAMATKSGPIYEKWLRNWQAATGLRLKEATIDS